MVIGVPTSVGYGASFNALAQQGGLRYRPPVRALKAGAAGYITKESATEELVQAVRNQDYPLMQGIFLVITLAVLGANWLVDMVYLWLDPRTREGGS